MRNAYDKWLAGEGCCNANNFIHIESADCKKEDVCECERILLEISNLHTDDAILQEEIDDLSGQVETKLDASAYTPTDLSDYYTKEEVDELIPSGSPITVDSELSLISTNPVQNKVITEALNDKLDASAYTPADLTNYVTKSELNQYITNLQQQINSLIAAVSGCCGSQSGETQYRWITMTGENDYWCSGTTKMSEEKEQSSTDGINWNDTGNIRSGSTVLEENCIDCGYSGGTVIMNTYVGSNSQTIIANICSPNVEEIRVAASPHPMIFKNCLTTVQTAFTTGNTVFIDKSTTTIENGEFANTDLIEAVPYAEITSIGDYAFSGNTQLIRVGIGITSRLNPYNPVSKIESIGNYAFKDCPNLERILIYNANSVPTLGIGAFDGCTSLSAIYVKRELEDEFKAASGWSTYADIIQGM